MVRFDLRDGGSTTADPQAAAYTLRDLAADAAARPDLYAGPWSSWTGETPLRPPRCAEGARHRNASALASVRHRPQPEGRQRRHGTQVPVANCTRRKGKGADVLAASRIAPKRIRLP